MAKIKKGDKVQLIAGKDKGGQGVVLEIIEGKKLIVAGLNLVKKHQKPNPAKSVQGGVVSKEMPLDISNVLLVNPSTGKGERVGYKLLEDGSKVRVFKTTGEQVSV